MNVKDVTSSDSKIETSHGTQSIPDMFYQNQLFLGGDDTSTVEVITSNPHCKGVALMNNKLFWNPDLRIAERIIEAGYGSLDQFRFYRGRMKWDGELIQNISERNLYAFVSTRNNQQSTWRALARGIWTYQMDKQNGKEMESLWYSLLEQCLKNNTKDIESWMQIYDLINDDNVREEVYDLMRNHDDKIVQQVRHWGEYQRS